MYIVECEVKGFILKNEITINGFSLLMNFVEYTPDFFLFQVLWCVIEINDFVFHLYMLMGETMVFLSLLHNFTFRNRLMDRTLGSIYVNFQWNIFIRKGLLQMTHLCYKYKWCDTNKSRNVSHAYILFSYYALRA